MYLAVNKDGNEVRFDGKYKPHRDCGKWVQYVGPYKWLDEGSTLPYGSIIALTGKKITFEDEPIKI